MKNRQIGQNSRQLNPIGLGCMGLSDFYGKPTEETIAIQLLHQAIELGVTHFDTAELYGLGANETLLGKAFSDRRDKVFIATKFGIIRDQDTGAVLGLDGSPAAIRRAVHGSLQRLNTEYIDLYYQHRMDPNVPVEETVGALAELVQQGKIKAIGLSECSADTLRRACAEHPIDAVQSEYSIFSRDVEAQIIPACLELGVSLVAYSPLGRGMLGGAFSRENKPSEADYRTASPRFSPENYEANLKLVEEVEAVARRREVHSAQIALAWVLGQGAHVHAIPGTTKLKNLTSNLAAIELTLEPQDIARLNTLSAMVAGDRYSDMQTVNR